MKKEERKYYCNECGASIEHPHCWKCGYCYNAEPTQVDKDLPF
jgi:hypothetical protein